MYFGMISLFFLKKSSIVFKTMDYFIILYKIIILLFYLFLLFFPSEYEIFKLFQAFSITNNSATNVLVNIRLYTVSAYRINS